MAKTNDNENWQYFNNYVLPVLKEKYDLTIYNGWVRFRYLQTTYEYYPKEEKIIQMGQRKSDHESWKMTMTEFIKMYCKTKPEPKFMEHDEFIKMLQITI